MSKHYLLLMILFIFSFQCFGFMSMNTLHPFLRVYTASYAEPSSPGTLSFGHNSMVEESPAMWLQDVSQSSLRIWCIVGAFSMH